MINCIICGGKTDHPSHDYCQKCFSSTIEELEKRYSKREASQTREDHREAPDSEPSEEDTVIDSINIVMVVDQGRW